MPFIVAVREDRHESYFKEFPTLDEARAYAKSESAINPLSITIAEVVERPIVERPDDDGEDYRGRAQTPFGIES